jgi:PAS domain-containing protein
MANVIQPCEHAEEIFFDDLIVSKTDLTGRITYANDVFCKIAGYSELELLGQPHSIIRHPDMPRAVFKYLWDNRLKLEAGKFLNSVRAAWQRGARGPPVNLPGEELTRIERAPTTIPCSEWISHAKIDRLCIGDVLCGVSLNAFPPAEIEDVVCNATSAQNDCQPKDLCSHQP